MTPRGFLDRNNDKSQNRRTSTLGGNRPHECRDLQPSCMPLPPWMDGAMGVAGAMTPSPQGGPSDLPLASAPLAPTPVCLPTPPYASPTDSFGPTPGGGFRDRVGRWLAPLAPRTQMGKSVPAKIHGGCIFWGFGQFGGWGGGRPGSWVSGFGPWKSFPLLACQGHGVNPWPLPQGCPPARPPVHHPDAVDCPRRGALRSCSRRGETTAGPWSRAAGRFRTVGTGPTPTHPETPDATVRGTKRHTARKESLTLASAMCQTLASAGWAMK